MERTEIQDLGEFGLIARITEDLQRQRPETLLGVGDDGAVLDVGSKRTVVSTDMLCEGIHFDLSYVPLKHLGYKAVVVNLSDICAMNAEPVAVTVSMALSSRFSVEAVDELYAGIRRACEVYKVDLIGGDTTTSRAGLVLSVTAIGLAERDQVVTRSGAGENDLVVVSGELGGAYMGLQVLEREKEVFQAAPTAQPDLQNHEAVLERQLKPEARVDVIREMADLGLKPTSMIDVSDGLASEALHLSTASRHGIRIYEEKLPIAQKTYETAREFNLDPTMCMLSGGEDYELLFTIAQTDYEKVHNHPLLTVIGHMVADPEERKLVTKNGLHVDLTAQGWDSMRDGDSGGVEAEGED